MLEKQRIKHKQECQIEGEKEKQQVRNVRCAAVQMCCSRNVAENIEKAEVLVRQAAAEGAQVILLPELFERQYFCQERRYDYYQFATPVIDVYKRQVANVVGCINDNGWVVYETDERGAYHVISKHLSEEEGLEALLIELRNKKRKEAIMKKLRK